MTLAVSLVLALESFTFSAAQGVPSTPASPSVPGDMPVGFSSPSPVSAPSDAGASSPVLPPESTVYPGGEVAMSAPPQNALCPLTNLPPHRPARPQARCKAASNMSCCDDCSELSLALNTKSKNLTSLLGKIAPGVSTVCDLLRPYQRCQHHLEAIICAINCNPDAARYVAVNGTEKTLKFCNDMAEDMFASCRNISKFLATLDAPTFLSLLFEYLGTNLGIDGTLKTEVVTTPECYGGPTHTDFPATPFCCDPLVIPAECKDNITDPTLVAAANASVGQECTVMQMQSAQDSQGSGSGRGSQPSSPSAGSLMQEPQGNDGVQGSRPSKSSARRNQAELGGYLLAILLSLWWFMSF
ncbi:hypothetical protein CBR_g38398 [Chara braunii]|uniref:Saposin B-type domain-containing protein n=1 Tax=Chara braunii TaxID=69332 RepID=A0A388JNG1_CHABU|nr:hypothetical protein CBR_g38398 [Chara braunii]|eukprot:GBG59370.1 hypothetical protein CBR_g38398 [Chara braunii]